MSRHQGFHEYCGATPPSPIPSTSSCVMPKGHTRGDHRNMAGDRWPNAAPVQS